MLPRSGSWPMQTVISVEPGGMVSAKLQQVDELEPCITPDLVPAESRGTGGSCKPDIFVALETLQFASADEQQLISLGNAPPPPTEMPPLQPVLFFDYFEPLDPHSNDSFVVQVHDTLEYIPEEEKVQLKMSSDSAFGRTCHTPLESAVHKEPKCQCRLKDSKTIRTDEASSSEVNRLISNYQINILRKSCLRVGRRESSFDLSGSFDKDSIGKRKPFERKLTSEFESVASNNTNTTDCEEKCTKRAHKRSSPANLIRSYSLGHERCRQKLNGTFKKFSLPTPASQLKEGTGTGEGPEAAVVLPPVPLDTRKVTTLARHYYPEGGWGIVVASCSMMVHVLCHGLQLSAGVLFTPTIFKFNVESVHTGKSVTQLMHAKN